MPGPISDSYDPEFGTGENAGLVHEAVQAAYDVVTNVLGGRPPEPILNVVKGGNRGGVQATLDERVWRCLRFACERALESL
jgi:hypothetical protein